jgi:hypothetical protein
MPQQREKIPLVPDYLKNNRAQPQMAICLALQWRRNGFDS